MPYQTTGDKTKVAVSKYQLFRILKQHYIQDMTQREIAVSEGLSTATVSRLIKEAKEAGFVNLKGHRTVGGMRASIYNAMPVEGVKKLVEFMAKFEEENK